MSRQLSILPFLYFIIILIVIICFILIKVILYFRIMKTIYGLWGGRFPQYILAEAKKRTKRNANEFVQQNESLVMSLNVCFH